MADYKSKNIKPSQYSRKPVAPHISGPKYKPYASRVKEAQRKNLQSSRTIQPSNDSKISSRNYDRKLAGISGSYSASSRASKNSKNNFIAGQKVSTKSIPKTPSSSIRKKGVSGRLASSYIKTNSTSNRTDSVKIRRKRMFLLLVIFAVFIVVSVLISKNLSTSAEEIDSLNENINAQLLENDATYYNHETKIKEIYNIASMNSDEAKTYVKNVPTLNLTKKSLDVPLLYQNPELPCGCESLALTNQLNYYGFNISKTLIAKKYLLYGTEDFVNTYTGNIYSDHNGDTIMSPGLTVCANLFLRDNTNKMLAYDVSGREFEDLFAYIERGNPVQIWVTLQMGGVGNAIRSYNGYTLYSNNHCVVLSGFDRSAGTVEITDSIYGQNKYSISTVKNVYNKLLKQAVVIMTSDEVSAFMQGKDASYDGTVEALQKQSSEQSSDQNQSETNQE